MSPAPQRWRLALFGLCAGALCLAAICSGEQAAAPPPSSQPGAAARAGPLRRGAALLARLRSQARRFLAALFRYEDGNRDRRVRELLRAGATRRFAVALLGAPPPPRRQRSPARLARLSVALIPSAPPRALVSGRAVRGRGSERFSLLFDLRRGRWLARGLGE